MDIDQRIRNILADLAAAKAKSEEFYGRELDSNGEIPVTDFFNMASAFDSESRLLVELDLAYSEKYPEQFPTEQIELLNKEHQRLTHRIRAWQNRQMPSKNRE